ncbi:MAG TPA: TerB family tellurite resistance protein [Gammaproteobacteria bacterium]|nr:TerB family tellurite resistance protein [Gammaproteobacteria bacterium]
MLNAIRRFFDERLTPAEGAAGDPERTIRLATAALLVEMTRMDDEVREVERQAVLDALRSKFGLDEAETRELVELAEAEAHEATDYFQFTRLINDGFSMEQKTRVIEHLWQVAYADGHLDGQEEHMIRRLADLLHVPHRNFINAKLRAGGAG